MKQAITLWLVAVLLKALPAYGIEGMSEWEAVGDFFTGSPAIHGGVVPPWWTVTGFGPQAQVDVIFRS